MTEKKSRFTIVLVAPEIPGNTGSIGRTCVALGLRLVLIKPLAFDISEKAVRRAGLDYWKYVDIQVYENFDHFLETEKPNTDKMYFFTKTATSKPVFHEKFSSHCYLVFGSETKGLPLEILTKYTDRNVSFPMYSDHIRSLNLSNVATAAAYEVLRQLEFQK